MNMHELDTSPCGLTHYHTNEWLQNQEPRVSWVTQPFLIGREFIKDLAPRSPEWRVHWNEPDITKLISNVRVMTVSVEQVIAERTLEERFREHADRWERDTAFISATPMRVMHESYQSIMSMGPDVVPLLLSDLQKTRRHWFWALRHLTGVDPIAEKDRGNVDRMIAAWTAWGKAKGKI
jgi:hypothetical protein